MMNGLRTVGLLAAALLAGTLMMSVVTGDEPAPPCPPVTLPAAQHVVAAPGQPPMVVISCQLVECQLNDETGTLARLYEKLGKSSSPKTAADCHVLVLDEQVSGDDLVKRLGQYGNVRVLSSPCLATFSGRKASLHAGGTVSVPAPDGRGQVDIGTRLEALPVLQSDGTLRLGVDLSVRELDTARAVVVNGKSIPAVRSRNVSTSVDMKPKHTIVLAGTAGQRGEAKSASQPAKVLLLAIHADVVASIAESGDTPRAR